MTVRGEGRVACQKHLQASVPVYQGARPERGLGTRRAAWGEPTRYPFLSTASDSAADGRTPHEPSGVLQKQYSVLVPPICVGGNRDLGRSRRIRKGGGRLSFGGTSSLGEGESKHLAGHRPPRTASNAFVGEI